MSMQIQLENLVPIPLKDRLLQRQSQVWNTNMQFTDGQRVKIKAPSGTGKTTLIHLLYKLRADYTGTIAWNQTNFLQLTDDQVAQIRQQRLSVVFQDLRLFANLTAFENIQLNRVLQEPYCSQEAIHAMAEQLGVSKILHQKAGLCSYGEQQRIAIIRALVQPFKLLLMDEPFSHLDAANTAKAAALIEAACNERNAGFVLTDLDDDDHFAYTDKLHL